MYRIIEPDSQQWDQFVRQQPRAHVLQRAAWGDLKKAFGWKMSRVALTPVDNNDIVAGAQVLYRPISQKLGSVAYLPMGPYITHENQWTVLWSAIRKRGAKHKAAFLKWEPGIYLNDSPLDFSKWGFVESQGTIQPPRTVLIDVRADDDTIMARMNQGTRRKIRKSLKSDIHYYEGTQADVAKFNQMIQTTGTRNDFGVHEPDYYEKAFALFAPSDSVRLFIAEHEGDLTRRNHGVRTSATNIVVSVRRVVQYQAQPDGDLWRTVAGHPVGTGARLPRL